MEGKKRVKLLKKKDDQVVSEEFKITGLLMVSLHTHEVLID